MWKRVLIFKSYLIITTIVIIFYIFTSQSRSRIRRRTLNSEKKAENDFNEKKLWLITEKSFDLKQDVTDFWRKKNSSFLQNNDENVGFKILAHLAHLVSNWFYFSITNPIKAKLRHSVYANVYWTSLLRYLKCFKSTKVSTFHL